METLLAPTGHEAATGSASPLGLDTTTVSAHDTAPPLAARPSSRLARAIARLVLRSTRRRTDPEAGDVPGWVMVTLMSALIVAGIYAVAGPALLDLFNNAINSIKGM